MIGPHLPFCLATIIKNSGNTKESNLQEDLSIERCFMQYVPTFKGCETFADNDNNDDLKKLRGYEFLNLRPDDEVNWEKYKEPLEMFNNGFINGWRFADAIVMGEVKEPSKMIKLEEWYGKGGKFNELIEEMGGVIPDPEPIPSPTQEEIHNEDEVNETENQQSGGSELLTIKTAVPTETSKQSQESENQPGNITNEGSMTIMTSIPTETLIENVNDEIISEKSSTAIKVLSEAKNIIDETDSISTIPTSALEDKILPQTKTPSIITPEDDGNNNVNEGDYDDTTNRNGGEIGDELPLSGEELAEP